MQEAAFEADSEAGTVLDAAASHACEALLDGRYGVGGREQLLDVGFAQIERHAGGLV